ncbi:MAG: LamG-like jellyroll fold domain-containing protein, partial [Ferruginibacter sp.]
MKKLYISTLRFKRLPAGILFFFISFQLSAQTITNYSFAASAGTFTALSAPTNPTLSGGNVDDGNFNALPIGFDFWYMGARYTTVSASTNGWLTLGSTITDDLTNNLSAGGTRPMIAPLWDDLDVQVATNVSYKVTGSVNTRVFTLQYLNAQWRYNAIGNTISFQVKLYESTGKIEFIYRPETGALATPTASIGITATATGSGNFLSLNGTGTAPTASSTTETTTLSTKPATGQTYAFTPPIPVAPVNLSFTSVLYNSVTLNWDDFSSNETGFVIYRSTDGVNYTFITQTAANATSSVQTSLTANTIYYWKVQAVTEGGLSTAIYGSKQTPCASPPAAPTVTSPVNYCQNTNAVALTATGTNLLWGGAAGAVGGTATLTSVVYIDGSFNNRKINFTTTAANVTFNSVDFYIPSYQAVTGMVLSIYNSAGTVIATSSTNTTLSPGAAGAKINNVFNYTITTAGDYSIGVSAGSGNIGSDNPAFPITESTGSINITGVASVGYRCFNNIQFTNTGIATAPVPATNTVGSNNYYVTQTVGGCTSAPATITVNVSASPSISQIPVTNLIANYKLEGNANDATGNNNGTLQNAPSTTADRYGNAAKAYTFNGSSQYISTANQYVNPTNFSISSWFKTSSTTGGKLIGFGNVQVGQSSQYDRHIYMSNSGQIYFGVYPSAVKTINSTLAYNDNTWHLATATLSSVNGMVLYIDGQQVAADPSTTTAENYTGYWKIGFDNNNGWTSQPNSFYFNGTLDDVLIYQRALTAAEALTLFTSPDGAGNNGPVCLGSAISLSATTASGATYAWTGPNSFTSALQNPSFTYAATNAGVYTLVASIGSCTSTAYTIVNSSTNAGQWTGNATNNWANPGNWCSGVVPTGATNVIISSSAVRMPSITSSVICNSITINTGATLTISSTGTLNVAGTLTNNGTIVNSGTTNFNGTTGQQTFSGVNSFYNLTLSNTNGLLLPNAITVANNLLLTAGILTANNFDIGVAGNWTNNASTAAFAGGTATVTFNGTAAQTIGGTFATTFNNLIAASTGSTVSLSANSSISGNLTVSGGTFDLATFTANRATAGGTLTVANNATLNIGGTNGFPTNYTTNTLVVASTVAYSGTNQTIANQIYGNLTLSSSTGAAVKTFPATALSILGNFSSILGAGTSVTYTAASNISIGGNNSIGTSTTFNGSSYTITAGGNWTNSGTFNGNTGTVIFSGPAKGVSGSGTQNFNNLTVSASLVTFSNGSISLSGNLATISSGSFTQASGGTLLMTGTAKTISGTGILIDNLTVSGTVTTAASFNLTGNLSVSGSITASAGIITMSGTSKTISGAGTRAFAGLLLSGSLTTAVSFSIANSLNVIGSFSASAGTATFTGASSFSGTANLFNTTINGTSLQLAANSILGIANTLTLTAGTLNVTSTIPNTVNFNGTGAQNVNAITYNNLVLSNGNTKTATGTITTNKDITIAAGTTFAASSYTHSIYGNWVNNGTFVAGTSTVQFAGPATAYLTGITTFNILTSNTSSASTELILNDNVSAAIVNMTNGIITTGTNTITITNTRTGNGFIYGNIQRIHTFTTGVAYAFEGPNNTVLFSAVSGVSSITVSAVQAAVADFPFGNAITRYYNIAVPTGTYTATLRLHYEDDELNGNPENEMGMWRDSALQWLPVGKTANDTVANYIEQSGLTNIASRWTCSINPTVVLWNGSVSSDWNTAANWTVYVGSGSTP